MLQAVGCKTGKVYARGDYLSDVFRELQQKFPDVKRRTDIKTHSYYIYPEQLVIVRRG